MRRNTDDMEKEIKSEKAKEVKEIKSKTERKPLSLTLHEIKKINQRAEKCLADLQNQELSGLTVGDFLQQLPFYDKMHESIKEINELISTLQKISQALNDSKDKLDINELRDIEKNWIQHVQTMCQYVQKFIHRTRMFRERYRKIMAEEHLVQFGNFFKELLRNLIVFNEKRNLNQEEILWKANTVEETANSVEIIMADISKAIEVAEKSKEDERRLKSREEKEKAELNKLHSEFKEIIERGTQINEIYNSERHIATVWFKKSSRTMEAKFIEEAVKVSLDDLTLHRTIDGSHRSRKINFKERVLVYLGALELIEWKLQHESRIYEMQSTLAKIIHEEIAKCRAFLHKTDELKLVPDNDISTKAYLQLTILKNQDYTAPTKWWWNRDSIWEDRARNYNNLWPHINLNNIPKDFDVTKARQARARAPKRRPGE